MRREQGRPAEAELAARPLTRAERSPAISAVLAAVLVDLGRDSHAWAELTSWNELPVAGTGGFQADEGEPRDLATPALFAEVAAALGDPRLGRSLYARLLPFAAEFATDATGAACHGSISRPLALLAHKLDRWEEACGHFDDALVHHERAAAPVFLAHTQRQYAALLRVRGGKGDWDRADELLTRAEDTYRRLGVERLADAAQAVLARAEGAEPPVGRPYELRPPNTFRRDGDGWVLGYGGVQARVSDSRGLKDLAQLLARPAQSIHVADLLLGSSPSAVGTAATSMSASPWRSALTGPRRSTALDDQARAEHRARLQEINAELGPAAGSAGRSRIALAHAERDRVEALLARRDDTLELARDAVAARIRLGIDHLQRAHPELGLHLRRSVRLGTFCSYEPAVRTLWQTRA